MIYPFFLLGENVFTFKHNPDIVVTYIKNERKKMILKSHIKRLALLFPLGIILFSGCATNTANYVCRHKAPGYAMAWHQAHGDNVRMLVGTTAKNEYHVIAQAQIRSEWKCLCESDNDIITCSMLSNFKPLKSMSVTDFIEKAWWKF